LGSLAKKYRRTILFCSKLFLYAVLFGCFCFNWFAFYSQATFSKNGNYVVILSYISIFYLFSSLYGCLKIGILRLGELIYSYSLSLVISNFLIYLQFCLIARTMLSPFGIVIMSLTQFGVCVMGAIFLNDIYFALHPARQVVAVCADFARVEGLLRKVKSIKEKYNIVMVLNQDLGYQEIIDSIGDYTSVLLCDIDSNLKEQLIKYCYVQNKRIYILPSIADIALKHSHRTQIFDTPMFLCRNTGLSAEQFVIKRIFDIVVSLLALIIFSPIMLISAIAIKLYDGGPVFFLQERVTCGGRVFKVIKFRSMVVDAESKGPLITVVNDQRVTPIGKIMRKIRIDEFPQLFNVLAGDMSIVGPRPERIENVEQYSKEIPEFNLRHRVKAGITGYAQIFGRYNTSPRDKLILDLLYIERFSFLLDIKLMFMTLKIMFISSSTQAFELNEDVVKRSKNNNLQGGDR